MNQNIKKITIVCPRSFEGLEDTNKLLSKGWVVLKVDDDFNLLLGTENITEEFKDMDQKRYL